MDKAERHFELSYPTFYIGSQEENEIIAVEADGKNWFLLYGTRELAELYVAQSGEPLAVREASSASVLELMLRDNPEISGFVWNTTIRPTWFQFLDREQFLG